MKTILLILGTLTAMVAFGQPASLTLKECVQNALASRQNIMRAKTGVALADLKKLEQQAKFLPNISLAYEYKYNPIIASQVIPIGQFSQVATDEKRAIPFGTAWQQNAGVTVYQPVFDANLKSRIKESIISKQLAISDVAQKQDELTFEVIKSYNSIIILELERQSALKDTLRSYLTHDIIRSKYNEGKTLATELNDALINHNKNLISLHAINASIQNEKINLSYLTNIPLSRLLEITFEPIQNMFIGMEENMSDVSFDSLIVFKQLDLNQQLLQQQLLSEKNKQLPKIGIQGFVGANQYTQTLNPLQANSWYGSSYIGLAVELPLLIKEKATNGKKQIQNQLSSLQYEVNECKAEVKKNVQQVNGSIDRLLKEIAISEENATLFEDNFRINQARYVSGKIAAGEINLQEKELQKISNNLFLLKADLMKYQIELFHLTGKLNRLYL